MKKIIHRISFAVLLPATFIFSACGGGASGTGIEGTKATPVSIQGTFVDSDLKPIKGASILVLDESEALATTDANGGFNSYQVIVTLPAAQIVLEFDTQTGQVIVVGRCGSGSLAAGAC